MELKTIRARAPLRLGLAGGGTDVEAYFSAHSGFVLNVTINKFTYATITQRSDQQVSFTNADSGATWSGPAASSVPVQPGLDLHCGVYNRIAKDFASGQLLALDITTHSEAPPGSGLGSSSTMVVTILKGFMELLALRLDDYEIANLAFDIERVDLKMAGGKQDQYAAAFGGLNYIEFYKDRVIVNPLRLKTNYKCEFESSLVLYFTGVSRQSAEIIEQQVSNVLTKSPGSLEAMHELKADALLMKEALLKGDFKLVSESMKRSWIAKKQTASSVSNSAIDEIFNAAMNSGALAGKVSGAGGGGFMMFLVDPVKRANVIATLNQFSGQVMTCGFVEYGAHAWRV